ASFLDSDPMPIWNGSHQTVAFSGKRVKRGLYRTADGHPVNADTNGAANILRKSNHRLGVERRAIQRVLVVARGLLANPLRVKLT
ncbi:MAG: transposase, partial [Firmicutes bacterium]|nr:transposase [Bacillota bacterium]